MTQAHIKEKARTSLRFQYVASSILLVTFLVLGTAAASFYFKSATEKNTVLLKLYNDIFSHVDDLRKTMWQADKSLYEILSDTDKLQENKITIYFDSIGKKLHDLLNVNGIAKTGLTEQINVLVTIHSKLNSEVNNFLMLRKDVNWLYPMLPFINSTLLEPNVEFETAINQAIKETAGDKGNKYFSEVYKILEELRNIWRLKILDFRGAIIRFAGLNTRNTTQENNIENYHIIIKEKLKKLSEISERGGLGFESEIALETMKKSSKQWYKNYQELLLIRKTNDWRSDINYIRQTIQPLQKNMFDELAVLEKKLSQWSSENTLHVDFAAKIINKDLWFLTSIAILFVVLIYFKLNKSLLLPIEMITEAIQLDSASSEQLLHIESKNSKEINILVNAFNHMRKQIHHRQMVLEFQAMHDSLTGLPNRALLQDRLEQSIHQAERNDTEMSLLLLDLDRFKDINDTLGHPVGDVVLRKISKRLEECLRATDTVARLGGDEFAIITSYSDKRQIESFIERIVKKVESVITINDQRLHVGLSVGVASFPKDGLDADTLIQHADIAMYSAKRENKNQEFYKTEKDYYNADNLTLLADFKAELKEPSDRIQLYFQPVVDIESKKVTSVETLIRWDHPSQGMLPAEQIIKMAEQTGLISELTYWVINKSIYEFSTWNNSSIALAINLSVMNLQDGELVNCIRSALERENINPNKITFEITESAVMSDPVRAKEVLEALNDMGVELSIDDYGTGFSSLAYLKLLPVKYLKIDKSFVLDMLDNENDGIIVHSTIELAHNLGLSVIAEGVESKSVFENLHELGCDYAQGYYISKPMPSSKIEHWFSNYNKMV